GDENGWIAGAQFLRRDVEQIRWRQSEDTRAEARVITPPGFHGGRPQPQHGPCTGLDPYGYRADILLEAEAARVRRDQAFVEQNECGTDCGVPGEPHLLRRREDPHTRRTVAARWRQNKGALG